MKKLVSASLLVMLVSSPLISQKAPMKFGKVSNEEVASKYYEPDSTVDAVVLCEYGVFDPEGLSFSHTVRYKIYSKEGLNSLIMSIPVSSKSEVKGMVYNMVGGKVEKSKLTKESIYQERVIGSYSRLRIAPPDAKEGSVIDIRYTMQGLPSEWNFQKTIPVLWSELVIPYSEYFSFNKNFIGYEPLSIGSANRWVAKDMPAFLPEPYVNSSNNYMTTMFLEISEIHISGQGSGTGYYENLSSTWSDVSEYFYDHDHYGVILRGGDGYLSKLADSVRAQSESDLDLMVNALAQIRKDIKWNKRERLFPSGMLRDLYLNDKTGSSTDMNFLFMKLLRKLDIECYPMLIRTRDEGIVNTRFPSRSRFNYTLSYVKVGDQYHIIDAADKYYEHDLLRLNCLNNSGFVVRKTNPEWVEIKPDKKRTKITNVMLDISEDGFIEGNMNVQHSNYAAASFRKLQENYTTQDEYLEDFEQDNSGFFVMEYSVKNLDEEQGIITETFQVEIDGNANVTGGMIYLNPVMIDHMEESPFKLEEREYPVDFGYARNKMYIMSMNIPEGMVVHQLPAPMKLVTVDKSGSYLYNITQSGSTIQIMIKMTTNKPQYLQSEYEELRAFFSIIVNKESEPIILKRANP
ncbi:MAG: hypothetical protein GY790_13910 [Bacteroidetes bacterium]|nr:hypothetical protein [Bacteroidota bacterium]